MTPERAAYHRLMLLAGLRGDYEQELDHALETLDPIPLPELELAFCMSDLRRTVSVLYNYTLDHPCDEVQVCAMVRGAMTRHYLEKSMTPEDISALLYRTAMNAGNYYDDPWYRLYEFSYDLEMYEDGLISRETFLTAFECRLLCDQRPDIWELQAAAHP